MRENFLWLWRFVWGVPIAIAVLTIVLCLWIGQGRRAVDRFLEMVTW